MQHNERSLFETMGGSTGIRRLVEAFYPKVQDHPEISGLFPSDITPVMEKQILFLGQLLGGPNSYTELYGHPMMRARHLPFPITQASADAWLDCMRRALEEVEFDPALQQVILERLKGPAYHFINS